ncbi:DNA polymerase III subunit beta [Lichenihabitans sp. Uapishka_5]|uniref:DNA polymerase III subunit beta n=1 Tax=Lichenihabitans sp. Uapishka_5 TaxID=3037302 RepID=UPI0029E7CC2E|nr:DNA polymerase III subunit beta [Lichenihabitans sp. Uapishka_5]MDX7953872.1 DNA polymerase III subunit beta [Lichenihabitans sp. Uapishka_5]
MKVTLERASLLRSLGHVHRVVERRTTIPILSNVLVRAEGGTLKLKATDLDLEVTEEIEAEVAQPGSTTLPAHVLHDIVRKFSDGSQVTLDMSGDTSQMLLRSGRSRFQLQCLPETDFPDISAGELTHKFVLKAGQLKGLIDKTQFAISTEETRYYLNGIFMHTLEHEGQTLLRAVSTDGHRLARVQVPAPEGSADMPGIIVPRKAVSEVQKLIDDADADVTVELSTAKIRFTFGRVILTTKLIDGTFPDYARVIPSGNDKRLTVDKKPFQEAVDRVSTISSERGRAVKLAIADGKLTLSVNNPDSGSATEELDVDYDAAPLDIGFNARYLLDIAAQLDGDTALLMLNDAGSPTVIQDSDTAPALYVLMPMRV